MNFWFKWSVRLVKAPGIDSAFSARKLKMLKLIGVVKMPSQAAPRTCSEAGNTSIRKTVERKIIR